MNNEIPPHLMDALHKSERTKDAIMAYPYYSDATRDAWFDAIDGWLDVRVQSYKNAKAALDEAFKNHNPCKSFLERIQ